MARTHESSLTFKNLPAVRWHGEEARFSRHVWAKALAAQNYSIVWFEWNQHMGNCHLNICRFPYLFIYLLMLVPMVSTWHRMQLRCSVMFYAKEKGHPYLRAIPSNHHPQNPLQNPEHSFPLKRLFRHSCQREYTGKFQWCCYNCP